MGVDDKVIPIHAEAHDLPFAQEFFDAAVSVDAYHYFGIEPDYLEKHFAPLVKKGGQIAVAVPGLKKEFAAEVPAGLAPYWIEEVRNTIRSRGWWHDLWKASTVISFKECKEMKCFKEAWQDWLMCDHEFARKDIGMMDAGGWKEFNLVAMKPKAGQAIFLFPVRKRFQQDLPVHPVQLVEGYAQLSGVHTYALFVPRQPCARCDGIFRHVLLPPVIVQAVILSRGLHLDAVCR
jgi:SAM-dependent methyltransferase